MINLSLDYQGFDALDAALGRLVLMASDLTPLAEQIRDAMIADNAERSLTGVDLNSVPLAFLTTETLLTRGGTGPPLAPQGAASRIVAGFQVDIHSATPSEVTIVGHWPTVPYLRYHVTGYVNNRSGRFVPARNPAGLTPSGADVVIGAFDRFVTTIVSAFAGP